MSHHLPPLNALKAFEAAARHLSVKMAADELCVTPGAVSQMLKSLETHLGVKLFERVTRGIYLTDAGRDYLPAVRNAFRQIAEASRRVMAANDNGMLTVSVTPFFASAWLVPRLKSFQEINPEIDLQIVASSALADFSRGSVDVAVRHGIGRYPGLRSDHVVTVEMVVVAAPALVDRLGTPRCAADLVRWPHVHDADRKGWSLWFQANGVEEFRSPRGPSFDDSSLILTAILSGQGAGLLPAAMIAAELAGGDLVQLLDATVIDEFAYYLVCPEHAQNNPKIAAFRDWILNVEKTQLAGTSSKA
ncbi:transcriptional regulator GcvA [Ensifer sp. ENS12]|uniref:transcriptional regulator GcvA n=1 Tax=Ensifer sp. ENS12 TaxID=2854774 RepID=UPI000DD56FB2|nr:transcriptional regulator GcvA [Ensifer sp. ENS12]MBV7522521.1 transcriptional regulator GcvA [Ensifer sp. ENS12]